MAISSVRELNKRNLYTSEQLENLKKFDGKYLNVYPHNYEYWKDGIGYVTVYEVRGISDEIRENFQSVYEIISR
jgi:hypothetical protein